MKSSVAVSNNVVRFVALAGVFGTQLWCASNDEQPSESPPSNTIVDGGTDATADAPVDAGPAPLDCSKVFCRVDLPGAEDVALSGIWKTSDALWVVGSGGFAARLEGDTWRRVDTGTKQTLFAAWGDEARVVWATASGNSFLRLNGAEDGGVATIDGGFANVVYAISGSSAEDVWAVGAALDPFAGDNVWHYSKDETGELRWRAASPPCESFGANRGCLTLRAVWAESAGVQWFAGDEGKIFRTAAEGSPSDDGRLRLEELDSHSLRTIHALWGFGPTDAWAAGAQGTLRHWNGTEWQTTEAPSKADLRGIRGKSTNDVWAVGDGGAVLHWDGQTWSTVETSFPAEHAPRLYGVADDGNATWIVGEGVLLRKLDRGQGDP